MLALVVLGCRGGDDGKGDGTAPLDEGTGVLGTGWANPFPSAALLDDGGHLALRDLPATETPIPVERLAWRTGFSPGQVSVLRLPGVDPAGFPDGSGAVGAGTVRMIDLTDGRDVRCLAELDAWPDAEEVATLVRPLEALREGHRIAVVVTTGAVARPARFDALLSDAPPASLAEVAPRWRDLVDALAPFVAEAEIAVAWDFPVADARETLRRALALREPSTGHDFVAIREADAGDTVVPSAWRVAEGSFEATDLLVGDRLLDLDADGAPRPTGTAHAPLYVHVPQVVKDAPAGSVPVLVFGHGIFGEPAGYLDDDTDPSRVIALADDLGAIVVATQWRGLSAPDRVVPIGVSGDFGRFPELTDLLVQAQVNVATLVDAVREGELLDDPVFRGVDGQSLPDRGRVVYYGISLGAIEGMVFLAQDPPIDEAVTHVGGAMWSTLLERSSNWPLFEQALSIEVTNPADRQVLYAVSQLWWDPVDPIAWTTELADRSFLLQESIGDEQVSNLGTEALARSVGLPLLRPAVTAPDDLATADAPLARGASALVQLDPEVPMPPDANRPAEVTHAHDAPRHWDGVHAQTLERLRTGRTDTFCGAAACAASNPGELP